VNAARAFLILVCIGSCQAQLATPAPSESSDTSQTRHSVVPSEPPPSPRAARVRRAEDRIEVRPAVTVALCEDLPSGLQFYAAPADCRAVTSAPRECLASAVREIDPGRGIVICAD